MRVLINGLPIHRGGSKTYFRNLIPKLGEIGLDHKFFLLHSEWQSVLRFELPANVTRIIAGPQKRTAAGRLLWEIFNLRRLMNQNNIDVFFSPTPATIGYQLRPSVVAIRNPNIFLPIFTYEPGYLVRNGFLRIVSDLVARSTSKIMFVSEYSKDIAVTKLGLEEDRTVVIYHGVGEQFINYRSMQRDVQSPANRGSNNGYLLTVSTIQTHKNYPMLIRAFSELCEREWFDKDLVIAGAIGSQNEYSRICEIAEDKGIANRVHYLGQVPYENLPTLYSNAELFVFPSILETFGHPLVEAMAIGVPVVASNTTAIPEICGKAAVYFDPRDVSSIAQAIEFALCDKELQEKMIERGAQRSKRYSWNRSAILLIDALVEVYYSGQSSYNVN